MMMKKIFSSQSNHGITLSSQKKMKVWLLRVKKWQKADEGLETDVDDIRIDALIKVYFNLMDDPSVRLGVRVIKWTNPRFLVQRRLRPG